MKRAITTIALLAAAFIGRAETVPTIQDLAARLQAVENYVAAKKAERAEAEAKIKERKAKNDAMIERKKAYAAAKAKFEKAFADYEAKYGQLVLVGYDEENRQRIYRRADGATVRFTVPKRIEGEKPDADTLRTRRRIRK